MLRMLVTMGGAFWPPGATNVNAFESIAVLPPAVTTTSPAPAVERAPTTAVIVVDPCTTTFVAGTPPMVTVASAVNSVPIRVTGVPPVVLPVTGAIDVTFSVGNGAAGLVPHATLPSSARKETTRR
jgi:hypothetical protein